MAVRHGASFLGLVSHMPSGPGIINEQLIAHIASTVPPEIETFLLTSLTDVEAIVSQHGRCGTTAVQLCDALTHGTHEDLRRALPAVKIVQVVHISDQSSVEEAMRAAKGVDRLLLDSGNPKLATKELGGTGRQHNWALSRCIVDAVSIPVFLAGGLRPDNVVRAFSEVRPFGLDLCSSVRTNDQLDEVKLGAFFAAINSLPLKSA